MFYFVVAVVGCVCFYCILWFCFVVDFVCLRFLFSFVVVVNIGLVFCMAGIYFPAMLFGIVYNE